MNGRKGQYYIVKPIALIMTIIVLFIMFFSLQDFGVKSKQDAATIEMVRDTSTTISILTNSVDCIAYNPLELGIYGSIVSVEKLEEFNLKYNSVEPECARNYVAGWYAEVEDLMTGEKWSFGGPEYSREIATEVNEMSKISTMPIAIRHSASEVNPGKIVLTAYYGELERLAGFIDYACMAGKTNGEEFTETRTFHITHPITNEDGKLCLVLGKDEICRDTYCNMLFQGIESDGEYSISVKYSQTDNRVVVRA